MSFTHSGNENLLNPKLHWYIAIHTDGTKENLSLISIGRDSSEYNHPADINLKFRPVTDNDEAGKN